MKYTILASLALILVLAHACTDSPKEQPTPVETNAATEANLMKQAAGITADMQTVLVSNLIAAVQDSGVSYALKFCKVNAYPLTDSISKLNGVTISRVSHKPRNPSNQANAFELGLIDSYIAKLASQQELEPILHEEDGSFTYYKAITIAAPLCLKCHGVPIQDIAAPNFIELSMLYPKDSAVNFKMGELRGLWKVEFLQPEI